MLVERGRVERGKLRRLAAASWNMLLVLVSPLQVDMVNGLLVKGRVVSNVRWRLDLPVLVERGKLERGCSKVRV